MLKVFNVHLGKLFSFILQIGAVLSLATFCKDDWTKVLVKSDTQSTIEEACLRVYDTPLPWQRAAATCRHDRSHLLMLDQMIRNETNNYRISFNLTFWSGMHIVDSRLKWDGTPPVSLESFNSGVRQWFWKSGNPEIADGCGLVSPDIPASFEGTHLISQVDCEQEYPFICMDKAFKMDFMNVSYCPAGYFGNLHWNVCYKFYENLATFVEANAQCLQDGARIARFSTNLEKRMLIAAVNYVNQNTDLAGSPFWIIDNYKNETQDSCYSYFINGEMLTPVQRDCNTAVAYFMCERNILQLNASLGLSITTKHENQTVLARRPPYATLPITCQLQRQLNEFEVLVFTHDGRDVSFDNYMWDASRLVVNIRVPTIIGYDGNEENIPLIAGLSALTSAGSYGCEIHKSYENNFDATEKVNVRYRESAMLIYKARVILTDAVPVPDYIAFNLYSAILSDTSIKVIGERLSSAVDAVSRRLRSSPLLRDVTLTLEYKDVNYRDGITLAFSLYGLPSTTRWYNLEREQQLANEIKVGWEAELSEQISQTTKYQFVPGSFTIKSTVGCSGNITHNATGYRLTFDETRVGKKTNSSQLCITDRQPLATAVCINDQENGASFGDIIINPLCLFDDTNSSDVTPTLRVLSELDVRQDNVLEVSRMTANLTSSENQLTSKDVIYTAVILTNIADRVRNIREEAVDDIVHILDNMLDISDDILQQAQEKGSATNRILEAMEVINKHIALVSRKRKVFRRNIAISVQEFTSDDPVTGIKFKPGRTNSRVLQNETVTSLMPDSDINTEEVDVALKLPSNIFDNGRKNRLFMQIYESTKLFKTKTEVQVYETNSRVVAAQLSINGSTISRLGNERVTTIFQPIKSQRQSICGYWNYSINNGSGGWATDGCEYNRTESGRTICTCDHLTNFAILIDFEREPLSSDHTLALSIITMIGLGLSVVGLGLSILSFLLFKQLRKGRARQTYFNLALALFCANLIFLVGVNQTGDYAGCIIVSILLHYFILTSFMWMLMEGILQYLRFVKVLGTYIPRFLLKTVLPAWGIPLIPVLLILIINKDLYWGGDGYCWLSLTAFYYAFALPVGLIILANSVIFVVILKNLLNRPKGLQSNQSDNKIAWMNFRAAVSVFILLGITWIFGYFAISDARLAFQYIFTFLNAFQGVFIFLLFTVRDSQVRQYWKQIFSRKKQTATTISTSSTGHVTGDTRISSGSKLHASADNLGPEDTLKNLRRGTYTKF